MIDEQWKPLEDCLYAVSNTGKVASLRCGWRLLRQARDEWGYPCVTLCHPGKRKTFKTHRLVAFAFLGEPPTEKHQVNHIDGDKTVCHVDNLEWATQSQNMRHRLDVLQMPQARGERVGGAKLKENQVREIKERVAMRESPTALAREFGVSLPQIKSIKSGRCWGWLR